MIKNSMSTPIKRAALLLTLLSISFNPNSAHSQASNDLTGRIWDAFQCRDVSMRNGDNASYTAWDQIVNTLTTVVGSEFAQETQTEEEDSRKYFTVEDYKNATSNCSKKLVQELEINEKQKHNARTSLGPRAAYCAMAARAMVSALQEGPQYFNIIAGSENHTQAIKIHNSQRLFWQNRYETLFAGGDPQINLLAQNIAKEQIEHFDKEMRSEPSSSPEARAAFFNNKAIECLSSMNDEIKKQRP